MSNKTLSELAKKYANGEIDKDNYRKSREVLISEIVSGKVSVKDIDFPLPLLPLEKTAVKKTKDMIEGDSQLSKTSSSSRQPLSERINKKSPLVFIIISTVIVLLLIILIILFYPKPPSSMITETDAAFNTQISLPVDMLDKDVVDEPLYANFYHKITEQELVSRPFCIAVTQCLKKTVA